MHKHTLMVAPQWVLLAILVSSLRAPTALAQEAAPAAPAEPAYTAVTTADPTIPVDELALLVKPLTKEELQVEADAWLQLVKGKVTQISAAEIAVKQKNRQGAAKPAAELPPKAAPADTPATDTSADDAAAAAKEAEAKRIADAKAALLEDLTALRTARVALMDRMNVVLIEWETKGGEIEPYKKYLAAVSGITVDITDTSATWATAIGWLKSDEGGLRWARNIGKFIVTLLAFYILARILGHITKKAVDRSKRLSVLMREFVVNTVRKTTLILGVIVALAALEVNIGPVLALIGGAAFVIGFALQGTLSNFASGIMILIYRPFDTGDFIDVAGIAGKVKAMTLVSTTVTTPDNKVVIVPNNSIWGNTITNITGSSERRVDLIFGIGYGDDIAKAQGILEQVVANHPLVLKDPAPVIKVHALADSSVNFVCRPWSKTADYWNVYWDITRTVKEEFDKQGVSIPFPQRDVHIYQASPSGA